MTDHAKHDHERQERIAALEAALQHSQEQAAHVEHMLSRLQEIAQIGIWELDLTCNHLTWSAQIYRLFGLQPHEFGASYQAFLHVVHPDDRLAVDEAYTTSLRKDKDTYEIEHRVIKADTGEVRYVQEKCTHIRDASGQIVRSFGMVQDITDRKRAEAERELLMTAIEQAGEAIVITDTQARYQYVNPAFERVTGYRREELLGQTPDLISSGEHDRAFYDELWQTVSRGEQWKGRMINRRRDGTLYTEETTIWPVKDESGAIVSFVSVKRDITEQLRLLEERARLEAQFRQAQKLESVGRLAGGVAHDLNNLLTPILGYGEILLESFGAQDTRRADLEQIVHAGVRARDIVRQLLAFSRKQTLAFRPVDLNLVLQAFEKLLRRTIREDVHIHLALAPLVAPIMADVGQLEQVIMNLAVNAQDAMPDGGTLTIETGEVELEAEYAAGQESVGPGRYVTLRVSDTGVGMDADTRAHLFEPFFTTKEKGTGLGLATVYGIVKQHEGHIWADSEPGAGTAVSIYLPAAIQAHAAAPDQRETEGDHRGSETILLVEDNAQVRGLALAILKRQGYQVLVAENGGAALTILDGHPDPVDLLLTDVVMPEMNGRDLYDRVALRYPGIKVLYMSGYTDDVIAHRGVLDEGVRFIQKPLSVKGLAGMVRSILDE